MEIDNKVASVLFISGIIEMIAGLFIGIVFGRIEVTYEAFNYYLAIRWWGAGFICGMMFIGFAEVIKLLYSINLQLNHDSLIEKEQTTAAIHGNRVEQDIKYHQWELPEFDKIKIKQLFSDATSELDIIETPFINFVLVILDDRYELIETGGFNPKIIPKDRWRTEILNWFDENFK
ncbi:hypothetical protein [Tuberibacillus sp. Marseille-P3662]|uniref:hypothetical protein n=1 Tax=Tuberibacillus sp. Marseille-P3662 TaxID=1965358 RepID=UPI000A1CA9AC|nr:hypothetical protein [Tuberibacillus sp. Marseille-P3662]